MSKKYPLLMKCYLAILLFFFSLFSFSQTFVGPGTDWNTASNWSPAGVPSTAISGTIIINSNVNVASITVKNGGTLRVNSPAILTVGSVGNTASTTVVDFQNGSNVLVNSGASLVVYGRLNNSNNSDSVQFNGTVSVDGNVTVGNGSTITGTGSLSSSGSVTGQGTVFGSGDDCTSNCTYGSCPTYSLTSSSWTPTCVNSTASIVLNGLPNGTYTVRYNTSLPVQTNLTATLTSSGGTGTFTATGFNTNGNSTVTITNISSGSCSNAITANNSVSILRGNPNNPIPNTYSANVCRSDVSTFSISAVSNALSYTWTTTASGWSINQATNGLSATVSFGTSAATNGTIVVNAINSCGSSSATISVNVSAGPAVGAIAGGSSFVCVDSSTPAFTNSSSGGSWSIINGTGMASINSSGVVTGITSGTVTVVYTLTSSGCSNSVSRSLIVNSLPTKPSLALITQPTCTTPTGSIALSGLPSTGTWTIIANPATSGLTGLSGSGTTTTIGGLVQGQNYNFAVFNGSCTSPVTSSILMNPVLTSTFNGSTWSNPPASGNIGVITAGNASPIYLNANVELCSCTISANTNLVVNPGFTLKIVDRIQVNTAGSLTFENNASLVQVNNTAVNSGVINYKRQTSVIRRGSDYTYWSSPVSNQSLLAVSPNTNSSRFWSFNPASSWFVESPSSSMVVGKGYIIRAPEFFPGSNPPSSVHQATFIGPPNNGVLTIPVGASGSFNLIGNPYPSAIDAVKFLNTNAAILEGTIYFWTHNTEIRDKVGAANEGSGDLVYIQDDYASFNRTGGVGTAPAISEQEPKRIPNGFIAAGQSFFTTSIAAEGSLVTFNNDMRLGSGSAPLDNSQFFKTKGTEKGSVNIDRSRLWLNLTNKQNAFKQTLIGYIDGATNDFDTAFDGPSFNANAIINFYSVNNASNYVIQGRALPFEQNDLVPLGYSSTIEGEFSISIDNLDGLFTTQNVFLEDKTNNTIHNLKTAPYVFQTTKGTFNDRFVLRYTDKTLDVEDVILNDKSVLVTIKNKQLRVISSNENIQSVIIYNILGKQVYAKKDVASKEISIDNLNSSEQALIVKTVLEDGTLHTTKAIYK